MYRSTECVLVAHHVTHPGNGRLKGFPLGGVSEEEIERIPRHERTGRPLGNDGFVGQLEEALRRILQRQKSERKGGLSRNKYGVPPIPPSILSGAGEQTNLMKN